MSDTAVTGRAYDGVDLQGADLELLELGEATVRSCRWAGSRWARALVGDCLIEHSDLGNVTMTESALQRVRVERSRLTGVDLSGCILRNTAFADCTVDLSNWRFAKLRRVVFEGCRMAGADLAAAELSEVCFVGCDLSGADFREATVDRARFERCTLDGIGGLADLRGAEIDPLDPITLGYQLAAALGITIVDPAPSD